MDIEQIFLFDGIDAADKARMISCFNIQRQRFEAGETIWDFDRAFNKIGIVMEGTVSLVRIDSAGNRVVLEDLSENDVFGEMFAFSEEGGRGIFAMCEKRCEIAFMRYENIAKRCENACKCHTTAVENMFRTVAMKTKRLSERIEILGNRSIRDKLLSLFTVYSQKAGSLSFELPFSLSYLADYICVDRSAMMRELRRMSDEGIVETERRKIKLLQ
ncbi:MAG: Crp/Fnr family transcriptional regulator [Oscillospiraceae bacterium]|nr:Crp/Fnr family transcriptional regulator [Oscillospiraceae bacterium]